MSVSHVLQSLAQESVCISLFTQVGGSGFVSSSRLLQGCSLGNKSHKGQAGGVHSTSGALPHTHLNLKTSVTNTHDNTCANINILCAWWPVDRTLLPVEYLKRDNFHSLWGSCMSYSSVAEKSHLFHWRCARVSCLPLLIFCLLPWLMLDLLLAWLMVSVPVFFCFREGKIKEGKKGFKV